MPNCILWEELLRFPSFIYVWERERKNFTLLNSYDDWTYTDNRTIASSTLYMFWGKHFSGFQKYTVSLFVITQSLIYHVKNKVKDVFLPSFFSFLSSFFPISSSFSFSSFVCLSWYSALLCLFLYFLFFSKYCFFLKSQAEICQGSSAII